MASLCRAQPGNALFRPGRQPRQSPLRQDPPMVAIPNPVANPASRFRFIPDRREVLGSLFVAPAILYVLLLVGVPFLMAVYYSVSAYTIYDPSWSFVGLSNFVDVL